MHYLALEGTEKCEKQEKNLNIWATHWLYDIFDQINCMTWQLVNQIDHNLSHSILVFAEKSLHDKIFFLYYFM